MAVDAFDHMEEAWSLEANPFPAEAIHAQDSPYSPTVFGEETQEFRRKLIRGSVRGNVNVGFLWSQGTHADTGFGKTTLMREITKEINHDLGVDTLTKAGIRADRQAPIAAAFSNLNNLNASGLYPVLFNAVIDLTQADARGACPYSTKPERVWRRLLALMTPTVSAVTLLTRGSASAALHRRCGPKWYAPSPMRDRWGSRPPWGRCPRPPAFATDSIISTSPLLHSRRPASITCT